MKVRLDFHQSKSESRIVRMRTLPRIGERLESGDSGTFVVGDVVHTPLSQEHDAVLILLLDKPGEASS
ncbi:MAG: hypothetical protein JWM16_2821 [Verrucomicrobiales bacterium]|nr:hypothetical protein [Verrucomicrobiales bacterium]